MIRGFPNQFGFKLNCIEGLKSKMVMCENGGLWGYLELSWYFGLVRGFVMGRWYGGCVFCRRVIYPRFLIFCGFVWGLEERRLATGEGCCGFVCGLEEHRLATGDRAVAKNMELLRVRSFCDLICPRLVVTGRGVYQPSPAGVRPK